MVIVPARQATQVGGIDSLESIPGQCCETVTIFYGSGSDFWTVTVPIPVPTFEKLRFQLHIYSGS